MTGCRFQVEKTSRSIQTERMVKAELNLSSEKTIEYEQEYSAHNYHPLPVVFSRASGAHVWDPEGKEYLDFLSAYSAVNQGHCHPHIIEALVDQASKLTLSSRAFSNDCFAAFAKYVTEYFDYESVLPMNTGAEAVESALKLACQKMGVHGEGYRGQPGHHSRMRG